MNIITSINENDFQLLVLELTVDLKLLVQALENFEDYSAEYAQLRTDKRRREFLSARILINKMLKTPVRIKYEDDGKPFIENHSGYISISHSKQYLALMFHPNKKVGVDIECPTERVLKVSHRFLHSTELAYIGKDLLKIQLAWSAKEALYKVVGMPAVNFSASMYLKDFELAETGELLCVMPFEQSIYRLHYIVKAEFNLVYTYL